MGRLNFQIIFGRVILLYQMPKAGSQTLEATLRLCGLPHHIVRLHFLSTDSGQRIRNFISSKAPQAAWQGAALGQMQLLASTASSLRMRQFLVRCRVPLPKIEVITAVRDVFGVALSCIFQNYRLFVSKPAELTVEKCRELLLRPKLCAQFQDWFDTELQPALGVNVFNTPFPAEKGFCQYQNGLARVLLYRFEELPRLAPILKEFLGNEIPPLVNRNLGSTKEYGDIYQEVRNSITLPLDFVSRTLESRLMRHFYAADERESLKHKWTGGAQMLPADRNLAAASRG